ncbi:MAG: hypothetical protein ACI9WU_003897 [Myxococcota bacterium]|jgi:hypothetical protein
MGMRFASLISALGVGFAATMALAGLPPAKPPSTQASNNQASNNQASNNVPDGRQGNFLGWDPNSKRFAYTLGRPGRTQHYFLKETYVGGVAKPVRWDGSVIDLVKRQKYIINELDRQKLSDKVQAFIVGPGKTMRIVLEVGSQRLSYSMWLDDAARPAQPKRLLRGWFNELWTHLEARAFRSPDGAWVAVILTMRTPWELQTWVEGVQVAKPRR